ncbi:MAG: hypothetical protein ACR2HF_06425, partial [Methylococcaceae bacterium]
MNNKTHSYPIIVCFTLTLTLPNLAHAIGENCSALLNLGKYNVTQNGSAEDAQALVLSTFCSSDFSKPNTDNQTALIRSAYRFFSDSDPASAPTSDIINAQASVCKGNFDKNSYLQNVPASSKSVYEESVSAWNRCLALANKGVIFDVQTSSDLLGLDVAMSVQSNSVFVKLNSVTQRGFGKSTCKLNNNGQLTLIDPNKQTPVILSTANKVMVNCERNKNGSSNGQDVYVNQQELVFQTSLDTLTIPLAGTANFSRMSANQLTAQINQQMDSKIAATNSAVAGVQTSVATVQTKVGSLETAVNDKTSVSDYKALDSKVAVTNSSVAELQTKVGSLETIVNPIVSSIQWIEITPGITEWSFYGPQVSQAITLQPSTIPTNARYVLADVFVTASTSDHQNVVLGRDVSTQKNWVDLRGQQ